MLDPALTFCESYFDTERGQEVYVKVMACISALKRVRDEVTRKPGTTLTKNIL